MANEKFVMMSENPTGTGSFSMNRRANSTKGTYSHAEGYNVVASGFVSHAEGIETVASGAYSHTEGNKTTASGQNAHAEGGSNVNAASITTSTDDTEIIAAWQNSRFSLAKGQDSHVEGTDCLALGTWSHAEGTQTQARGARSHTEGSSTIASADSSHSGGHNTIAANYASTALGKFNANMTTGGAVANTTGTAFVIGNGTSTTARSNALSVQFNGVVKAKSTITASTTADYAEFFEWADGNPDAEDRVGYFVTLEGDKIKIASSSDDYIIGVVSGEPFVLGNGDCDTWTNMHLRDEFRRTIYEPAPKLVEILDEEGLPTGEFEEVEGEYEGERPKLNPEYDPTQEYVSRFDRPEWSPIGMLGVLAVCHDGTAQVDGYVTVNAEGIATACEEGAKNSYRVIKSNADNVVEIIFASASSSEASWDNIEDKPENLGQVVHLTQAEYDALPDTKYSNNVVYMIEDAEGGSGVSSLNDVISDAYDNTKTYNVGDYCIKNNVLYKCNTAIETAEEFDSAKWIATSVDSELHQLNSKTSITPLSVIENYDRYTLERSGNKVNLSMLCTASIIASGWTILMTLPDDIMPKTSIDFVPYIRGAAGRGVINSSGVIVTSSVTVTDAQISLNLTWFI